MRPPRLRLSKLKSFVLAGALLALGACAAPLDIEDHRRGTADDFMVAVAHPLAAQAGFRVLANGGSAVDAAIAVQMMLTLVEPQSSGIGGGAFMVHYDAETGDVVTYDGRETAPASATPEMFLKSDGDPMRWRDAALGGRAVGVPGVMRMLELAHADHGRLTWAGLFDPAIRLADDGFAVTPRLAGLLERDTEMREIPGTREYFYPGGTPLAAGDILKNASYANMLRQLAAGGADAFYDGPIADGIAATVRTARNPATITAADFAGYVAKRRPAVCAPYRAYRVCGMGPPSSGGILVAQILGMLSHFEIGDLPPYGPEAMHLLVEASRLAFADRARYLGDSDFVDVPVQGLVDPAYLQARAALIRRDARMPTAAAGDPNLQSAWRYGPDTDDEKGLSTTHFSIRDRWGDTVSMTSTIERAFGAKIMSQGILLNNELTDFSFRPTADGRPVANAVAPGKRPRSTMSPSLIFDADGNLLMAIGSPGGSRIAGYTLKTIINVLDWNRHIADAIAAPHVTSRGGTVDIEPFDGAESLQHALDAMGHKTKIRPLTSGLHGIHLQPDGSMTGGADPRREGVVLGF